MHRPELVGFMAGRVVGLRSVMNCNTTNSTIRSGNATFLLYFSIFHELLSHVPTFRIRSSSGPYI